MAEPDDDREAVDRAFAALVAGYHLTAERPTEPQFAAELTTGELATGELGTVDDPSAEPAGGTSPAAEPAETTVLPPRPVLPTSWRVGPSAPLEVPAADERYVPDPLPPLARPGAPALIGWAAVLFAAVVVLAAGFGVDLPEWLGWLAVSCFIVGSVVLLTQLPRHRPPDAGDGAVL